MKTIIIKNATIAIHDYEELNHEKDITVYDVDDLTFQKLRKIGKHYRSPNIEWVTINKTSFIKVDNFEKLQKARMENLCK